MEETTENIISAITKIKIPGIATMDYWSIIRTDKNLYFLQTDNVLGLGVGTNGILMLASVAGDVIASHKSKMSAKKDINTIISESIQYFCFSSNEFEKIKIKKRLLGGGIIIFSNGKEKSWKESGIIKMKLSRKKFKVFLTMIGK